MVSAPSWLHRFIIGKKGQNLAKITQQMPKVCERNIFKNCQHFGQSGQNILVLIGMMNFSDKQCLQYLIHIFAIF